MAEILKSWRDLALRYRSWLKLERRLADHTVAAYMHDVEFFGRFIVRFHGVGPCEVEAGMVEHYVGWLYEHNRKASSQARLLSGVRSFYGYLVQLGAVEASPAQFIETPRKGRPLPELLTIGEVDRIIAAASGPTLKGLRDAAMLETLYSCGLRVSELTALRLSDLFFGEGYIRVTGKGDKQRLVPVSDKARDRIGLYLEARPAAWSDRQTLFLNNRGAPLTRVMLFTIIRQAALRAGIDRRISPHTFRHSFATHLLEGGASIRQVQEMLGHESILTTEIYTHLDRLRLRRTVEEHLPAARPPHAVAEEGAGVTEGPAETKYR